MLFFVFAHDYMIGLISEESLTFGLLAFLRLLKIMGTFEVGVLVFYMFKYDPYSLMCLNNYMQGRQ